MADGNTSTSSAGDAREGYCTTPYIGFDAVETTVERRYASLRFTPEFTARVREIIAETLADDEQSARLLRKQLTDELKKLDTQEENLLDLAAVGESAKAKARARLNRIEEQRQRVTEQLGKVDDGLAAGAALIEAALRLLQKPVELYRRAGPRQRRLLNQAIFERLCIDIDGVRGSTWPSRSSCCWRRSV